MVQCGKIWVESELNKGSEFFVELPANKEIDDFNKVSVHELGNEDIERINIELSDLD
ncbi:hypothetical protein L21TH_0326 [Caldisalinibacter kiritimatiensis]|uniref:Uncharacterized protein n=2 Tax=Caldisalinibacter kiritimatiensis TaxID=1304284 RepID=R1AY45_9FIRM|nr:hypothetical protein L21TH_0326 [Caldisalinibacter kiritimatiensis]